MGRFCYRGGRRKEGGVGLKRLSFEFCEGEEDKRG